MAPKYNILLSADLEPFLSLDDDFSTRENFRLIVAQDGVQAWQIIQRQKPDLVFLSLHSPLLSGDQCCRKVRQDLLLKELPVVLVIDRQSREDLARCLEADCTDIIFLPFSNHLLLATSRRLLGLAYRSFNRIATRLIVRYGLDQRNMHHGFSCNLSSGGMFIETEHPFDPSQELFLDFSLPNTKQPVVCKAFVAWSNPPAKPVNDNLPPGMGVQFLSLSLPDLLNIWDYFSHIEETLPASHPASSSTQTDTDKHRRTRTP
ncbi:MAG: PilZ domain-containing protein [Syntrophotaleaceae bacterium]